MSKTAPPISIEQAKELVALLEAGNNDAANELMDQLNSHRNDKLFTSVGKLTRDLHDALQDFQVDPRILELTQDELPDAKNRLQYVISKTEDAANRTMDAVEASLPIADDMHAKVSEIQPVWERLMNREIELSEFKALCHQVDQFITESGQNASHLHGLMTEVLMAQDYQDITGQVIRRVIELVQDVEKNLIELLKLFGDLDAEKSEDSATAADDKKKSATSREPEGPIIDPENRDDVVDGQDEVDDLLSSLGF